MGPTLDDDDDDDDDDTRGSSSFVVREEQSRFQKKYDRQQRLDIKNGCQFLFQSRKHDDRSAVQSLGGCGVHVGSDEAGRSARGQFVADR